MHDNALPLGHYTVKVPSRRFGTDLASICVQLARNISRDWKRVWREESELAWPLARAQPLHLSAKLIRFLLHSCKLLVDRLALLNFTGERTRDLKLPSVAAGLMSVRVPMVEG